MRDQAVLWTPFFTSADGGDVSANRAAIDTPHVPVDATFLIQANLEPQQHAIKQLLLASTVETVVHRLPRSVALRQITPRGSAVEDPQHAVDHHASDRDSAVPARVGAEKGLQSTPIAHP